MTKNIIKTVYWVLGILFILYNPLSARIMTIGTAEIHNIDRKLFYNLIKAESSFYTLAHSRNQAVGLAQVKVATAKYIYPHYFPGILWIPPANLHIGALYYNYLSQRYKGNITLILAAYNWGETNVDQKLRKEGVVIDNDSDYTYLFVNVPETYFFVKKIMADSIKE